MKKILLSCVGLALGAVASMASEYTLDFEGSGDLYGLTRYTAVNGATYTQEISISQGGIDFTFKNSPNEDGSQGNGFALIDARTANGVGQAYNGLLVAFKDNADINIAVPGGKISGVKVVISSSTAYSTDLTFSYGTTSKDISGDAVNASQKIYSFSWKDTSAATDNVNVHINGASFNIAQYHPYIHSIEVTYTADLGGKQECGLSFASTDYTGVMGQDFKAPTLRNPNKLNVTWSSSDESIATVDANGKVTLVGAGTVKIIASTEGNDEFAAGNAQYSIMVTGAATTFPEMIKLAPKENDKVLVDFDMTVTYATAGVVYIIDEKGNAGKFHDSKNDGSTSTDGSVRYNVGDVIPAGWMALHSADPGNIWSGTPADASKTVEVVYPEVTKISYEADNSKILVLKNVTFDVATPDGLEEGDNTFYGTTTDGERYKFDNSTKVASVEAGKYDVVVAVSYFTIGSTPMSWLIPIEYLKDPVFPETFNVVIPEESGITVNQSIIQDVYNISVTGESNKDTVTVTIEIPAGWDGFIGLTDSEYEPEIELFKMKALASEWAPIDAMLQYGMKKGNSLTFDADGEEHMGRLMLYKGDMVDTANNIEIEVNVKKNPLTGVETIEAEADARYFNLQGAEVINPEAGVYVKVVNGKATKVVVK